MPDAAVTAHKPHTLVAQLKIEGASYTCTGRKQHGCTLNCIGLTRCCRPTCPLVLLLTRTLPLMLLALLSPAGGGPGWGTAVGGLGDGAWLLTAWPCEVWCGLGSASGGRLPKLKLAGPAGVTA